jgi:serine/threonine-protein kinase ULK4
MHALDHENILKFFAWYETQNHLWLILEYCVGGDLLGLLRQDVTLPEASIAAFGRDLLVALRTLHSAGTLHCDLKPSNVLVDEDGRLKLCGFGLARRVADVAAESVAPTGGQLSKRGTPCYMVGLLHKLPGDVRLGLHGAHRLSSIECGLTATK